MKRAILITILLGFYLMGNSQEFGTPFGHSVMEKQDRMLGNLNQHPGWRHCTVVYKGMDDEEGAILFKGEPGFIKPVEILLWGNRFAVIKNYGFNDETGIGYLLVKSNDKTYVVSYYYIHTKIE